ncbi:MAG: bifunctional demethylmenaquinone methyltransferase/2-methoxy-6-polyprenyl-1,4-benzoquinol methylase UbiE [Gomphosphaeria aponina SAG 52.96 = DSM 107014]|uniref:2-phytyl-1,4-naphtoquinone methyltransferase n=1 Tax=Gomphosphaeria aponina SAG 52.96 = DSM 107014 TaxID=1521640 RepID=A0A941JKU7_9CHRO|nr:bifunctional demethylmenaquinone methyltransferase/2-methoxy-6-polyprenyl-1,4-benzoquinol methylase UbiE [Gomphosphaeria aponina SAG 52.96 = DSM 107014]
MSNKNSVTGKEVQTLFNRIAPVYDQMNNWLSFGQHRIWKLMAVKWSSPRPEDRAIDLCCGSGDLTQMLARQVPQGRVYGVDFSQSLLALASQRASAYSNISWVEADVLDLPFEANYFDCATMGYGLRNVRDIPRCLGELYRILKPGATAAILDFHRPRAPVMEAFQRWYLDNIVVPTAQSFGLTEEYAYIMESLEKFPTGKEQVKLALETGFKLATHYPIALGMMGVLVISKEIVF